MTSTMRGVQRLSTFRQPKMDRRLPQESQREAIQHFCRLPPATPFDAGTLITPYLISFRCALTLE